MITISEIFKMFGQEYVENFGDAMPDNHHKVIRAIVNCRTAEYGTTLYKCEKCGEVHTFFRSCGNRHCPTCQNHKTKQWLGKQLEKQLPGHHFMITFTVPSELRFFIRSNQKKCYSAMFKSSSQTLKTLAADEKYIGGDLPGFFGVLHTWGRTLNYHPHIHYIVPGGALSKTDNQWHSSRIDFYVPVKALSMIFKAKFRDEMKSAGLFSRIPQKAWDIAWNVNIQPIGASEQSIKYLAPYVFKVAITNHRIIKVENHQVFFRYKKPKSKRWRVMSLDAMEFMRRFLQHVLPSGFMKVRYYGFMHPNSTVSFDEISSRIELAYGFLIKTPEPDIEPKIPIYCPSCGGKLIYKFSYLPSKDRQYAKGG